MMGTGTDLEEVVKVLKLGLLLVALVGDHLGHKLIHVEMTMELENNETAIEGVGVEGGEGEIS